jgi:hypothetical protein
MVWMGFDECGCGDGYQQGGKNKNAEDLTLSGAYARRGMIMDRSLGCMLLLMHGRLMLMTSTIVELE